MTGGHSIIEPTARIHGCVPQMRRSNDRPHGQEHRQTVFGLHQLSKMSPHHLAKKRDMRQFKAWCMGHSHLTPAGKRLDFPCR